MGMIHSLLDIDFYKLTMAQVAWKYFRDVPVVYSFKNRTTSVSLGYEMTQPSVEWNLEDVGKLRFTDQEIDYLRESKFIKRGLFCEEFLQFLANLELPPITVKQDKGQFLIETSGSWPEAILWETIILGTVNELYYLFMIGRGEFDLVQAQREGIRRLDEKIKILQDRPDIKIIEFGTRRRFGFGWQMTILDKLLKKIPDQIIGTSNVRQAKLFNIKPVGTFAHEMYMAFSGIFGQDDEAIRFSHNKMLEYWWKEYGDALSIALTDTYGSDFFFRDFTKE